MMIEMELREIQIKEDSASSQVIILGEKDGPREFPIYIGLFEAYAMDTAVRGYHHKRPMTHDLVFNVIGGMGGEMVRVLIDELREDTFHGKLVVQKPDGEEALIDSRPSDAIVLACKAQVPIFVADEVLDQITRDPFEEDSEEPEI